MLGSAQTRDFISAESVKVKNPTQINLNRVYTFRAFGVVISGIAPMQIYELIRNISISCNLN